MSFGEVPAWLAFVNSDPEVISDLRSHFLSSGASFEVMTELLGRNILGVEYLLENRWSECKACH